MSVTGPFQSSGPSDPAGWYAVKTSTGKIGLVLHHGSGGFNLGAAGNGTVTDSTYVGDSSKQIWQLASSSVETALNKLGMTTAQGTSFITQMDTASGKQQGQPVGGVWGFLTGLVGATPIQNAPQTSELLVGRSGNPTASSGHQPVSTQPSGDVQDVGSSLDPSWTGAAIRIGEGLLGIVLLIVGLHALTDNGSGNPVDVVKTAAKYVR